MEVAAGAAQAGRDTVPLYGWMARTCSTRSVGAQGGPLSGATPRQGTRRPLKKPGRLRQSLRESSNAGDLGGIGLYAGGSSEIAGPHLRASRPDMGDTEQTAPQKPESQSSTAYFLYLPLR